MLYRRIAIALFACLSASTAMHAQTPIPSALTLLDCAGISTPNQKKDEETIRRIEQDWLTAEYHGNPQFLECLLEPDYRTSGRNGKRETTILLGTARFEVHPVEDKPYRPILAPLPNAVSLCSLRRKTQQGR
jgi:hypothetical protein